MPFNSILVNEYPNGDHYISAHSDSKVGIDPACAAVATISIGAVRKFRVRDKETSARVKDISLLPHYVYVMEGEFQKHYTHEIPKQAKKRARISFTFRRHTLNK